MVAEPKRVTLGPDTDPRSVIEDVRRDGTPRLIERDGQPWAVIAPPSGVAEQDAAAARLAHWRRFAGIWSDIDGDAFLAELDRIRHESPPSPPVEL